MTVDEFWSSTMNEVLVYEKAFVRKMDLQLDQLAWVVAHVIAPHVKRPPTIEQLRGRKSDKSTTARPKTKEEFFAPMKEAKRRLQEKAFEESKTPMMRVLTGEDERRVFPFIKLVTEK